MDEDKPYSLGWWLTQLVIAEHNRTKATQPKIDIERFTRYGLLTYWITRRIVRKYGMRDYGAVMAPLSIVGESKHIWTTVTTPNTKPVWLCIQCGQMDPAACARPSCPWLRTVAAK
jgi:hypothetical protein